MAQIGGIDWLTRLNRLEAAAGVADDTNALQGAAIVPTQGVFHITAGKVQNLTLAAPIAGLPTQGGQDGLVLRIVSASAFAHVITTPANGLNGSKHIATFGAAVGNGLELHAKGGTWLVFVNNGVVLT